MNKVVIDLEKVDTGIFTLIKDDNLSAIESLLETSPEAVNEWQMSGCATPLHAAVNNPDLAKLLLSKSADIDLINNDHDFIKPIHQAAIFCDLDFAKLLIDHGADTKEHCCHGTLLHCLLLNKEHLNENFQKFAELILSSGVKINEFVNPGHDQWTALHQAANEGLMGAAMFLLENGADTTIAQDGLTTKLIAEVNGHNELAEIL